MHLPSFQTHIFLQAARSNQPREQNRRTDADKFADSTGQVVVGAHARCMLFCHEQHNYEAGSWTALNSWGFPDISCQNMQLANRLNPPHPPPLW